MLSLVYIIFVLHLCNIVVYGICPQGWSNGINGLCYQPFNVLSTWYGAESKCVSVGGHLASVPDGFTNSFLAGLAESPFNHTNFWLGGTTNFHGGDSWGWSDYANFSYTNWASGNPSYNLGYCSVQRLSDGKWLSESCSQKMPFICEYNTNQGQTSCTCPTCPSFPSTTPSIPTTPIATTPPPIHVNCTNLPKNPLCPDNWIYYNITNQCYFFSNPGQRVTWNTSLASCSAITGASLAVIHSAAKNTFLTDTFNCIYPYESTDGIAWAMWVGLRLVNGKYTWIDNSELDYSNWGEQVTAPCVHLNPRAYNNKPNGTWYASICDQVNIPNFGYICQYSL